MSFDIDFPGELRGDSLDDYLSRGWYRIGQAVFTTDAIDAAERAPERQITPYFRVFWLRFRLSNFHFGKKQKKLLDNNRLFKVDIQPLEITPELESLYTKYKSGIDFTIAPTLFDSLYRLEFYELPGHQVYDSHLITVRDGRNLIAAGIFDMGSRSIAGIINMFHPDYRKYSPGKYLMLLKLEYAVRQRMNFYYPGYISCDFKKFDYKLFPGKHFAEVLDPTTEKWLPYSPELMDHLRNERN
jgi:leucyl-tRNA---protein transferase